MSIETITGLGGLAGFLFFIGCIIFGVTAILMPVVVILIHSRIHRVCKILENIDESLVEIANKK